MTKPVRMTTDDAIQALGSLLPQGVLWRGFMLSLLYPILGVLGSELALLVNRAIDVLEMQVPGSVDESLYDWAAQYGVPGNCDAGLTSDDGFAALVDAKAHSAGRCTAPHAERAATAAGVPVTITAPYTAFQVGHGQVGDQTHGSDGDFIWVVTGSWTATEKKRLECALATKRPASVVFEFVSA